MKRIILFYILFLLGLQVSKSETPISSLYYGYCKGYGGCYGNGFWSSWLKGAIEIPAEKSEEWKGNRITRIRIGYGNCEVKDISVFITKNLSGKYDYEYTQNARIEVTEGWNDIVLDTPYQIDGDKFFIGYAVLTSQATDRPIGIDRIKTDGVYGNWLYNQGIWTNMDPDYGNVCIQGCIEGENLPLHAVEVSDLSLPMYCPSGENFDASFILLNNGTAPVDNLTISTQVGSDFSDNVSYVMTPASVPSGGCAIVTIEDIPCNTEGKDVYVNCSLNQVNGMNNFYCAEPSLSGAVLCLSEGYDRNVVVEEWTGTWCVWCVRGIVGMQYMNEKYGEGRFIGIAAHNGDEMAESSYAPFISKYSKGFPGCMVNRLTLENPTKENLERRYQELLMIPSFADLNLSTEMISYDSNNLEVRADVNVEFTLSLENADLRLAFVITEDEVGPYLQKNAYAGGSYGEMGGWEKLPATSYTFFDDVARVIDSVFGIPDSLPSVIEKDRIYSYSAVINASKVDDIANTSVVAMIIDASSGEVVNARKVRLGASSFPEKIPQTLINFNP